MPWITVAYIIEVAIDEAGGKLAFGERREGTGVRVRVRVRACVCVEAYNLLFYAPNNAVVEVQSSSCFIDRGR